MDIVKLSSDYICRLCLQFINHEPVKMTRTIINFIERNLRFTYISCSHSYIKSKPILCAVCFNKFSDFQDFFEQCKEINSYWRQQYIDKRIDIDNSNLPTQTKTNNIIDNKRNEAINNSFSLINEYDDHEKDIVTTLAPPLIVDNLFSSEEEFYCIENDFLKNIQIKMNGTLKNIETEIIDIEYDETEHENIIESLLERSEFNAESNTYNTHSQDIIVSDHHEEVIIEKYNKNEVHQNENTKSYNKQLAIDEFPKPKKVFQCDVCSKYFDRIYDIEIHMRIHNNIRPYVCDVCGRAFRQKNILATHQTLHYGKKIQCGECDKKFARKSQLILHNRMHRDEKPFACDFKNCTAAFRQRQHLIDHKHIHTREKNFQCIQCDKRFLTRKRLHDHIYKVHSEHRYRCDICMTTYLKPHMLRKHLNRLHNVQINDVSHMKIKEDISKI